MKVRICLQSQSNIDFTNLQASAILYLAQMKCKVKDNLYSALYT